MSTIFINGRDVQGYNANAPRFPTDNYTATLAMATEATVTVPNNFPLWIAEIATAPGKEVWCALNATAAVPAGATLAASTSVLVSSTLVRRWFLKAGDVLHFITATDGTDISVSFYSNSYPNNFA